MQTIHNYICSSELSQLYKTVNRIAYYFSESIKKESATFHENLLKNMCMLKFITDIISLWPSIFKNKGENKFIFLTKDLSRTSPQKVYPILS